MNEENNDKDVKANDLSNVKLRNFHFESSLTF